MFQVIKDRPLIVQLAIILFGFLIYLGIFFLVASFDEELAVYVIFAPLVLIFLLLFLLVVSSLIRLVIVKIK